MRTLIIGNKCYSSWSLRPWILMKTLEIPFEEILIPLDQEYTAERVARHSPAGLVPVLLDDDFPVWDSLAIMERLAEDDPRVWPAERDARARARSLAAEMHAGFAALRRAYPMNLGKRYAPRERPEAARDVARIITLIEDARRASGDAGPFLFGPFTAADAMYAPVMSRFETYNVLLPPIAQEYKDTVLRLPGFQEWRAAAIREPWVLTADEVDEEPLEDLRATTKSA